MWGTCPSHPSTISEPITPSLWHENPAHRMAGSHNCRSQNPLITWDGVSLMRPLRMCECSLEGHLFTPVEGHCMAHVSRWLCRVWCGGLCNSAVFGVQEHGGSSAVSCPHPWALRGSSCSHHYLQTSRDFLDPLGVSGKECTSPKMWGIITAHVKASCGSDMTAMVCQWGQADAPLV